MNQITVQDMATLDGCEEIFWVIEGKSLPDYISPQISFFRVSCISLEQEQEHCCMSRNSRFLEETKRLERREWVYVNSKYQNR